MFSYLLNIGCICVNILCKWFLIVGKMCKNGSLNKIVFFFIKIYYFLEGLRCWYFVIYLRKC